MTETELAPPAARWRVWLMAAGRRRPVAPAEASVGTAAVAAAGGLILAAAEGAAWPAAFTPPVAVAGHLLVDRFRRFHLPVLTANLLGLAAAGAAVTELSSGEIEARLLFAAHLLVYLTWIVLLQRKTSKVCWSLVIFAVLQVAVASVLTASGAFGLTLLGFLGLALWAMTNLSARWPDFRQRRPVRPGPAHRAAPAAPTGVRHGRVGGDPGGGVKRTVATVGLAAALVGAALFLLIPRVWLSRRPPLNPTGTPGIGAAYTGFSGEVRLGALGEILESREPAFSVGIDRPREGLSLETNDPAAVLGDAEPLFRGRTLDRYADGRWSDTFGGAADWRSARSGKPAPDRLRTVERYRLRPIAGGTLFQTGRADAIWFPKYPNERAPQRDADGILARPSTVPQGGEIEYVVYNADPPPTPPRAGLTPERRAALDRQNFLRGPRRRLTERQEALYLQRPGELPAVAAAARAAVGGGADEPPDALPDRRVADRLTAYLRDSGRFRYSLDLSVQDPTIDAVEDFLANKRVGHCEYFATALALMLRDRGVPSRVVTGFKGGDFNTATRRLAVEQRHAHAWVEAYLGGRWETFDPTPAAARTESVAASGPRFPRLAAFTNGVERFWVDYVVTMSLDRQQSTFGAPFRRMWTALRNLLAGSPAAGSGGGWEFDARGGALAGGFLLALAALGYTARGLLARRWRRRRDRRARAGAVRFWRRFEQLAARHGLRRTPAETPAEFAARAAGAFAGALTGDLAGLPAAAAAGLYAVRFGGVPLPADRAAGLSAALDRLDDRLNERRRSRGRS